MILPKRQGCSPIISRGCIPDMVEDVGRGVRWAGIWIEQSPQLSDDMCWVSDLWSTLAGGLVAIFGIFPEILGMLSSQLTNSYFSEGWPNHQPAWEWVRWESPENRPCKFYVFLWLERSPRSVRISCCPRCKPNMWGMLGGADDWVQQKESVNRC